MAGIVSADRGKIEPVLAENSARTARRQRMV
jgi:hypothetical protein